MEGPGLILPGSLRLPQVDERQARQELEEDEAKLTVDTEALQEAKREVQDAAAAARAAQREFERLETAIPKAEMEAVARWAKVDTRPKPVPAAACSCADVKRMWSRDWLRKADGGALDTTLSFGFDTGF